MKWAENLPNNVSRTSEDQIHEYDGEEVISGEGDRAVVIQEIGDIELLQRAVDEYY